MDRIAKAITTASVPHRPNACIPPTKVSDWQVIAQLQPCVIQQIEQFSVILFVP